MRLAHVPPQCGLEEEHDPHGEGHVGVPTITDAGVRHEHQDVPDHIGEAGPHPDLMEHFSNNTEIIKS